jgi:Ni2+-binding GTPase involved in maturation of urease and hydrogenase
MMRQSKALAVLKSGKNVFLTGSAGAGKTYVLNQFIQYLKEAKIPVAVTASTGIAATHMNGMTIHSWSGIGVNDVLTP